MPLVDHRFLECSLDQGPGLRDPDGWTKWVLCEAMSGTVREDIGWTHDKVGSGRPSLWGRA